MWVYPSPFGNFLLMVVLSLFIELTLEDFDSCLVCSYAENHFPVNEDKKGDNYQCLQGAKVAKFKKTCKSDSCIKLSGVSDVLGEIMLRNCSWDFKSDNGKCMFIKSMSMELEKKTSKPIYLNDVRICICNHTDFCNDEPGAEAWTVRSRSSWLSSSSEFQIIIQIIIFYLFNI